MNIHRTLPIKHCCVWLAMLLLLAGCGPLGRPPVGVEAAHVTPLQSWPEPQPTPTRSHTPTPTMTPTWPAFLAIPEGQVTQVPPQARQVELGEDIEVWLLMGTDKEAPYVGLTNAFHLVLVNPRFAKASVISVPGNLFVYMPGHGMQRVNAAYALGGFNLVRDVLIYNFGVRPDRMVLTHPTEFKWLVDDLGGLEVSVLTPIRDDCGGLPAGTHNMDGAKAYCYAAYLDDEDEIDRLRRNQQILQLLFDKLTRNGRMAALPVMYVSYQDKLETDFSLLDILGNIPLALRLSDPERVNYIVLGWDFVSEWELPDNSQTSVLLPQEDRLERLIADTIADISKPSPLTDLVLTHEAQLTAAVAQTLTLGPQPTFPGLTATITMVTPIGTPTRTPTLPPFTTPTRTRTPTPVINPTSPVPTQPTIDPYPFGTPTTQPTDPTPYN